MVLPYNTSRQALLRPSVAPTVFAEATAPPTQRALACEAARLAYLRAEHDTEEGNRLIEALRCVGFAAPRVLADPATGAFAYCTYRATDGLALVAFRGTEPDDPTDLITDLRFLPSPWGVGRVHAGFARAALSLRAALTDWLETEARSRETLLLCGHSLGAALTTLFASLFEPAAAITLGSPRVGDELFVRSLSTERVTRIVNCSDIVTSLPPASPHYQHVGRFVYVDAAGVAHEEADRLFVLRDQVTAQATYAAQWLREAAPDALLLRPLADHSPINYVRAFFCRMADPRAEPC